MSLKHKFKFNNGITAYSKVSNFEGVVTSRSNHLNGCDRYWVQPKIDKNGKLPDGYWIDENELVLVKGIKEIENSSNEKGGFPSQIK